MTQQISKNQRYKTIIEHANYRFDLLRNEKEVEFIRSIARRLGGHESQGKSLEEFVMSSAQIKWVDNIGKRLGVGGFVPQYEMKKGKNINV